MSVIIPEGLQRGDLVGIAAPGSPTTDPATVDRAVDFLSSEGFKVRCPAHIRKRLGYLAGNDAERCADLHELFDDRDVKAIFCLRGGYGCGRLLPLIDYELIGANPKWLIGYSDVTALQMAFFHRCHLASLHGPLLDGKFLSFAQNHRSWMDLMQSLTNPGSERVFQIEGGEVIRPGKAEGILLGGNLSIIHSMAGPLDIVLKSRGPSCFWRK